MTCTNGSLELISFRSKLCLDVEVEDREVAGHNADVVYLDYCNATQLSAIRVATAGIKCLVIHLVSRIMLWFGVSESARHWPVEQSVGSEPISLQRCKHKRTQ